ncbi:hypothetical protein VTJ04DRAFT_5207 [Mycothermus thermophilus]|jgi:peptidoglycan/LPS O-acetylase OafA/YrhL|uniref:uncharacterized protein n=1 Tax=Humicola insolens TaxID=85995 RepID=UPI00374206C1
MKSATLRWLRNILWPRSSGSEGERKLRPTAYLDGLRGFAAFLVYVQHHEQWAHSMYNLHLENAFGWNGQHYFISLPFVRNFFIGGHMAVAIFYVISGYVLSVKPLSLIHDGEYLKLFDNLASAFFRRWFRLFIPLIVVTFVTVCLWNIFGVFNPHYEIKSTLAEEIWNWYIEFKNFSFLFKDGWLWVTYNAHLWSIPFEMRGSIVTFTACIALARATHKARLLSLVILTWYFLYVVDAYYCALFTAGMLHADLDLLARRVAEGKPNAYFPRWLRNLEPYQGTLLYLAFVTGLYFGGVPSASQKIEDLRANPGWYWLSYLKPQAVFDYKWFYLFVAGNLIVLCAGRLRWFRRFLESRFCQFLGRVSFALYLVHGPILATVGDRLYFAVGWHRNQDDHAQPIWHWVNRFPLPKVGPLGLELNFLAVNLIMLPFTLWVADVVTRAVDEPAVKFAAWLYKFIQRFGEGDVEKQVPIVPLARVE